MLWREPLWWLLCEAANSATDLCACWLEASGLESERTEDACLLILACIAAEKAADEAQEHGFVSRVFPVRPTQVRLVPAEDTGSGAGQSQVLDPLPAGYLPSES